MQQVLREAKLSFVNGEYQRALNAYNQIIDYNHSKGKQVEAEIYHNAGVSAWEVKDVSKAIEYLEKAKLGLPLNPLTLFTLAKCYRHIDNLSREINNLEEYISDFPSGDNINEVRSQLFMAYITSKNWDLAYAIWKDLGSDIKGSKDFLVGYMIACQKLEYNDQRDKTANQILKIDKNNVDALEVLAEKFFWLAENSYQKEMEAYNKNKTNKQYSQLLKALETINENLRTSRDYFERLYKIDPKPKYATFLGNIYTRFENKEKADFYYRKAKDGK